jgi:hypothetical protein
MAMTGASQKVSRSAKGGVQSSLNSSFIMAVAVLPQGQYAAFDETQESREGQRHDENHHRLQHGNQDIRDFRGEECRQG